MSKHGQESDAEPKKNTEESAQAEDHGSGHGFDAESKLVDKDQERSSPETALQSEKKEELDDSDTFHLVVTSDNHLGYSRDSPLCAKDSFRALNEIFESAKQNLVLTLTRRSTMCMASTNSSH
jgi:hypothetical protein